MRITSILFLGLLLTACSGNFDNFDPESLEMGSSNTFAVAAELYKDPNTRVDEQKKFVERLKKSGKTTKGKREIYEQYVDTLGANGILDSIEELWPKCHSEAHDLGKVIFSKVNDIGLGLRICADRCYSGCMHGVLMEAFGDISGSGDPSDHVDIAVLEKLLKTICYENETMRSSYSEGDCAHGIGHALMVLAEYDIPEAISFCDTFENPTMDYYCATGAYMEYVTQFDKKDLAAGKRLTYPCDVGKYPAACARYKLAHVVFRLVKKPSDVQKFVRSCNQLNGVYRLGCYHGSGNAFMPHIAAGKVSLSDVCGTGSDDERYVCIEGAIERMAKFHPKMAKKVCGTLSDNALDTKICNKARRNGMYNMKKDMRLYL